MHQSESLVRQDNGCFGEDTPIQTLPTAVAVGLVFPFHSPSTLRADRETGKTLEEVETADLYHRHGLAEGIRYDANGKMIHNQSILLEPVA